MTEKKKKVTFKDLIKSKKAIAVFLIAASVIIGFTGGLIQYCLNKQQSTFLEMWYYSSQIIGSIFMTSGVVIAVWQYYLSSKSVKKDLEIQQVQRAIDLSEYFKDNILSYMPAIRYVFKSSGAFDILGRIDKDTIHDFDIYERDRLFKKDEIEKLKLLQESEEFYCSILAADMIYSSNLDIAGLEIMSEDDEDIKEIKSQFNKNSMAVAFLGNMINKVLNNLEYFALHFTHNTADESVVYQSLHGAYLDIVHILYYYISTMNDNPTSKLYTNVIRLYELWLKKHSEQLTDRSIKSRSVESHGTIIHNE